MPELTDDSDLKQRILEESKEYFVLPPQNGEFTRQDFMDAHDKMTRSISRRVLREMEKDGKIYVRDGVMRNGKNRCTIYGWRNNE